VPSSGGGLAVEQYPRLERQGLRVAVIGLGTGTMAAYGKQGDVYRFYDIDPKVVAISERYFTFRAHSEAQIEIVLGDARVRMEREPDQKYDVIVLDAFSGDAIPAHLLTEEAIRVYERHLRKNSLGQSSGIIAVHISNRYLDLKPVVAALARKFEFPARIAHVEEGFQHGDTGSDWILLTRNQEFWHNPAVEMLTQPLQLDEGKQELLWTDQRSSLLPLMD
jgi:spermidine synthase